MRQNERSYHFIILLARHRREEQIVVVDKETFSLGLGVEDDAVVFGLEPLHRLLLHQAVRESNSSDLSAPVSDIHASPAQDDVEVHTVDTNGGIVLDAQVDVLLDAEAKVSVVREVLATQFVLTNLQQKHKLRGCS